MGLLSKASTLDTNIPGLAFSDFINKNSLKFCALLEKNNINYFVKNSLGFDAHSILSSVSTVDFWNGICPESRRIYNFSDSDNSPFLQLFSERLKEKVKEISVYKNSKAQIIICQDKLSDNAAKDLETIDDSDHHNNEQTLNSLIKDGSVVSLFTIDFLKAAEAFFESCNNSQADKEDFIKALTNEVANRFSCMYNITDSTTKAGRACIKTVLITGKAFSVELIKHHLLLNLKEVLEEQSRLISIDFSGTADSCESIHSFLQAE